MYRYYHVNQNRDFCIKNLTRDFLNAYYCFKGIEQKYRTMGIDPDDFDRLLGPDSDSPFHEGLLVRIRDLCPRIRANEEVCKTSIFLFRSIITSLYYEMSKLREICKSLGYADKNLNNESDVDMPTSLYKCRRFFDVAIENLHNGFDYLLSYIEEGAEQLWCLLLAERDNNLLVRFLLKQLSLNPEGIWDSHGGIRGLLDELFPEGLDQAYCFAAEGYFEGCWYGDARVAYETALQLNPNSIQAKDGLHLLNKRLNELAELQEMERRLLERQLVSLGDSLHD